MERKQIEQRLRADRKRLRSNLLRFFPGRCPIVHKEDGSALVGDGFMLTFRAPWQETEVYDMRGVTFR